MTVFFGQTQQLLRLTIATTIAAFAISLAAPLTAFADPDLTNNDSLVHASEIGRALQHTDGVLAAADQTNTTSDSDSAIKAAVGGASVDIPKDADGGIVLDSQHTAPLAISLPNAQQAQHAKQVAPGTVAYGGTNGSATAVQATEDGGVRMLTVIDTPTAPTAYTYGVTVPAGGHVELTSDGGAVVIDTTGTVLVSIATPWAKDANGTPIDTHFTTNGNTLTQHIAHNVPGIVYPITADPKVSWGWSSVTVYLNRNETRAAGLGAGAAGVYLKLAGIPGVALFAASVAADWAADRGLCLAIAKNYVGPHVWTWTYKC